MLVIIFLYTFFCYKFWHVSEIWRPQFDDCSKNEAAINTHSLHNTSSDFSIRKTNRSSSTDGKDSIQQAHVDPNRSNQEQSQLEFNPMPDESEKSKLDQISPHQNYNFGKCGSVNSDQVKISQHQQQQQCFLKGSCIQFYSQILLLSFRTLKNCFLIKQIF